ncbi:hypothetical protein ABEB36_004801 [Hypothenemus hampei]|uniref:THAP-type domain-containing protein n=1 Tax=Hypothenemus hampei TaxID=57062 RepID=A0ABD1EVZ1_HYPHA
MVNCSAVNCKNRSKNNCIFHRFPADPQRRKRWLINCRRINWTPSSNSRLCSDHFEPNQYEQNRQDGRKLLKPNAIPTLFQVPNPPKLFAQSRRSTYKVC